MENYEDIVRECYTKYQQKFINSLTSRYPTLTLAEAGNLYQDTFLAIHDNLAQGRISENTSWRSYIMAVGLNLASKEMRRKLITDSIDQGSDADEFEVPSYTARSAESLLKTIPEEETPLYQNQEAQSLLGEQLMHTPEPCGSIIRLFYYENLSMEEIAGEVGLRNAATAKSKKSQCMKELVKRVKNSLHNAGITA
jgi:RNA polymerase sigma factor (sigma-70 family)